VEGQARRLPKASRASHKDTKTQRGQRFPPPAGGRGRRAAAGQPVRRLGRGFAAANSSPR
jgi:hypothetical protein